MIEKIPNSIYGPVKSWRLGLSLGVDVLCVDSICSFECVYCQLGKINRVTSERAVFVTTEKVLADLKKANWQSADVITFSGSGEPTLAANLGEIIKGIKDLTAKPVVVLTNSTLLNRPDVRADLLLADQIFCKLDAFSADSLRRIDRPAPGITLETIIEGIRQLRAEFNGFLAIQMMILRIPTDAEISNFAEILNSIEPSEVQLNLPSRPIPQKYFIETRGNEVQFDPSFATLKTISKPDLNEIRDKLKSLTNSLIITR